MRTIHQVSALCGVSIRTLQYYDRIGLLPPDGRTGAGYRLYGDTALKRLQQILLFRSLGFPLKEIQRILERPDFDGGKALAQQIELLELKKAHLERLIDLARELHAAGGNTMELTVFDRSKLTAYAEQARAAWGETAEYRAFEEKSRDRTPAEAQALDTHLMAILAAFAPLRTQPPAAPAVQAQVQKLQDFISRHYYPCSDQVLAGLGAMYAAGGEFTANIDRAGGAGTAEFICRAIGAKNAGNAD